jgi:hypothetical protein
VSMPPQQPADATSLFDNIGTLQTSSVAMPTYNVVQRPQVQTQVVQTQMVQQPQMMQQPQVQTQVVQQPYAAAPVQYAPTYSAYSQYMPATFSSYAEQSTPMLSAPPVMGAVPTVPAYSGYYPSAAPAMPLLGAVPGAPMFGASTAIPSYPVYSEQAPLLAPPRNPSAPMFADPILEARRASSINQDSPGGIQLEVDSAGTEPRAGPL